MMAVLKDCLELIPEHYDEMVDLAQLPQDVEVYLQRYRHQGILRAKPQHNLKREVYLCRRPAPERRWHDSYQGIPHRGSANKGPGGDVA
jgi:hypothetical protein